MKPGSALFRGLLPLVCPLLWLGLLAAHVPALDEAERKAELARIQKELAATQERLVREYIAEQPPGARRADVNLIIGTLYEIGQFGEPDSVRAAEYYRAAAEEGSPDAVCALAHMYDVGGTSATGEVPRDPARARALYERAAGAGSVRAMVELGTMYADGRNIDPDPKKALEYFLEAAKWGDATALDRLKPVMLKAREWEDAKPDRKGKAGFPTSQEGLIDKEKVEQFIDVSFNQQKLASAVYVEISRRMMAAMKRE
jgi:TPR repeat protein